MQWQFGGTLAPYLGILVRLCKSFTVLSQEVARLGGTYRVWRPGPGSRHRYEYEGLQQKSWTATLSPFIIILTVAKVIGQDICETIVLYVRHPLSPSKHFLIFHQTRLVFHNGSTRVLKNPQVLSTFDHDLLSQSGTGHSITNWADKSGEFKRGQSQFRNHISKKPGAEFPPEKGRYHLYVSYACPWGLSHLIHDLRHLNTLSQIAAHRTLIVRNLKGLEDIIPFTSVHWEMLEKGS